MAIREPLPARVIEVEVAHATPGRQCLLRVSVTPPCTVERAIRESGILERFPGLEAVAGRLGVFGEVVDPGRLVAPGDRVEIYRPLALDPKEARRLRARSKERRSR